MTQFLQHKITKRKFLITTMAATAAALTWDPLVSLSSAATVSEPRRLRLNGDWRVSQVGKNDWFAATVPGCVHTDLLAAKRIPEPFYRENSKTVQWVGESDWVYKRTFNVPDDVLKNDRVLLRCEGLDTLATIKINSREIGRADNMFRLWEFDVKPFLQSDANTIEVSFQSPFTYFKQMEGDLAPAKWIKGRAWVRKEPCSFGWDWGPDLPSCGIWKNITLETFNDGRIADVLILQHLDGRHKAMLDVTVGAEMVGDVTHFQAVLTILDNGKVITKKTIELSNGQGRGRLEIHRPKLWWPAGMGEQPLYEVHVELLNPDGKTVDTKSKRIGLRTLKAVLPQGDMPLHFEVNGLPFFAKGANWIPCDSFTSRVTPEILRRYVADAAAVNINTLRFWGGGYYEDDALFDACDEMGICVWLDFKFACAAYPAFDREFMENVRREARDNLCRLRHHPCIVVWCGNNEISLSWWEGPTWGPNRMSTADYDELFKDLIAEQVRQHAPQATYVSGSPDCGDTHYWEVWHGPKTFDAYRTQSGFMSEFGFQSFPGPKTIDAFTEEADRKSVLSAVMNWHQRDGSGKGNEIIRNMILHYFRPPKDFESTLWLSQILQGYGIKIGAEYWRQTMPKSMGCVYWQYNDIWPGTTWSSVDYFGRWKALHYLARKFYAPILVSGLENMKDGTIELFVTSDLLDSHYGKLNWRVTDLTGKTVSQDSMRVKIPARKSEKVKTLNLQEQVHKLGANKFYTWLTLEVEGKAVSENLVLLALPKKFELPDPKLATDVNKAADRFWVTVKSENPALWTWLDLEKADAKYGDNFVHILPDAPQRILVQPEKPMSREEFTKELRVRSLFDTCEPA
jgi:beta-mannosidase